MTSAPPASAPEGVISGDLPDLPEFSNAKQGAIDDVTVDECDTEPGAVSSSGTATNSGRSRRDVVVVMSWTVGSTGDVVARAIATVEDLEPGGSAPWRARTRVPGDVSAACVPSAWAGQLEA